MLQRLGILLLLAFSFSSAALPPIAETSLQYADARYDERAALVWGNQRRQTHSVRLSSWYAVGLLARDQPGDRDRAAAVLAAVLQQQVDEPGVAWNGTFHRSPQEPRPPDHARMWQDYDPNWRQFIGCAFAQILLEMPDRIPGPLARQLEDSICRALEGELAEGRLRPGYTNIALMQGFLLGFAGDRLARPEWTRAAEEWIDAVHAEFAPHGSFEEYNSPTYYGVDFYGLALLRRHGATARLRERGTSMETALWRDVARFYHAGLRNLAGPFDRTYGMDLTRYVSLLGVWLALELPGGAAPLPALAPVLPHGSDLHFAPLFALLGTEIPEDVRPALTRFTGERQVERPIADGRRVATAWLEDNLLVGGQFTNRTRHVRDPDHQFRPATMHWRLPNGEIGWLAVVQSARLDATAGPRELVIATGGDCVIRVHAPGVDAQDFGETLWRLPGLELSIESNALGRELATADDGQFDLTFRQVTRLVLRPRPLSSP